MPKPLKLLIVEDNPDDAEMELLELRQAGFDPDWQRVDTEAAFLAELHGGLDLVLSDFQMPQFNGLHALELLRQSGLDIPFILVSGTIGEDIAVEAIKKGATDYLLKDRLARLGAAVTHALAEHRLRRERKQADQAAQRQLAELRVLFDLMPAMIWFKDTENRILRINRLAAAITGKPVEEIEGRPSLEIYPQDAAKFYADDLKVIQSGTPQLAIIESVRDHAGHELWVQTDKVPYRDKDGKVIGIVVMAQDITERMQADETLRQSEQRFKLVARAVSDVVWDWNLLTDALWWSDGFLTTFGFAAGEIEPSIASWTSRIHPDERSRVAASIRHAIDTGAESWAADYRFARKDGSHAFVEDRGYILRDAAGRGLRMVGGMRDLTEQKAMETRQLRAQRMESIGTLAGGIAHDLNNVLAPIMMSIELLKLDSGNDPHRTRILDIIHASGRRGADLVRQILTFARGADGERIAIRLHHMINDLEGVISGTFPRNIRIVTDVAADLWPITGDPTQLHQVLLNLAVNARDAMPLGGQLTIAARNVTSDAQAATPNPAGKAGSYVLLQVTDTGQGIPPEVRKRIFEPFFTTKEPGKGTGIGLATVHTVIKNHSGFITFESELGRGTTFQIHLPAEPSLRATASVHPFQADLPRGHGQLILVVDDEFSIREITRQTLETFGYRVITASDGAEGVALYARQVPQIALVITDMMMPVMDGAATIEALRQVNPAVLIITASGIASDSSPAKPDDSGTKNFLLKPYTADTLIQRVHDVLDQSARNTA